MTAMRTSGRASERPAAVRPGPVPPTSELDQDGEEERPEDQWA